MTPQTFSQNPSDSIMVCVCRCSFGSGLAVPYLAFTVSNIHVLATLHPTHGLSTQGTSGIR